MNNEVNNANNDNLADLVQDYNDNEGYGPAIKDNETKKVHRTLGTSLLCL